MAVLTRVTDFVPSTLVKSQEVDDELNQLVNILSGISTNKDVLVKFSDGTNPVLRVDQLGAGSIQQWLNNGTVRASMSALGKLLLPAGVGSTPSTDQISNLGTYFADFPNRDTGANTTETDLSSKTVSANVLAADGDFMLVGAGVTYAANANTKRYRLYFGGQVFYDSTALAFNALDHFVLSMFMRRGSAILSAYTLSITTALGLGSTVTFNQNSSMNFATSNTLKSTGQNGTASASDISQRMFIIVKGSV